MIGSHLLYQLSYAATPVVCGAGILQPVPRTEVREGGGERGRDRTFDLLVKSQLLYRLSYAPDSAERRAARIRPP